MAAPTIVWRNPNPIQRRRLWSRARRDASSSLYVIVRSAGRNSEWEGLPNLEMIAGGESVKRGGYRKAPVGA